MKKSCNNCRAMQGKRCEIGFDVKNIYYEGIIHIGNIPLENCPKPKTYKEYLFELRKKR